MRARAYPFLKGNSRKAAVALYCFAHYFPTYFRGIYNINLPKNKFIILGMRRTGSSLLGEITASHPGIYWDYEKFKPRYASPLTFLKGISGESSKMCYGVKVFPDLFFSSDSWINLEDFLQKIYQDNWKIITIIRKNSLRQAISQLKANYKITNSYQLNNNKIDKIHDMNKSKNQVKTIEIDPKVLINYIDQIEEYKKMQAKATSGLRCLDLAYENDLENDTKIQTTSTKIFDYLQMPQPSNLKIFLSKQSNLDLFDKFTNKEELIATITNSKYNRYLN